MLNEIVAISENISPTSFYNSTPLILAPLIEDPKKLKITISPRREWQKSDARKASGLIELICS